VDLQPLQSPKQLRNCLFQTNYQKYVEQFAPNRHIEPLLYLSLNVNISRYSVSTVYVL